MAIMQMLVPQMITIILVSSIRHASTTAKPKVAVDGCQTKCGNVEIPFPFGIGPNQSCYLDEWFQIDCNDSTEGIKPFLRRAKLEVWNISIEARTLRVHSPVTLFCEGNNSKQAVDLTGSPITYSQTYNIFTAISCNTFVLASSADFQFGGCGSVCDNSDVDRMDCVKGINCCQTSIPPYLTVINATLLSPSSEISKDCANKFAFLVDKDWFQNSTSYHTISDYRAMRKVPVALRWRINNDTRPIKFYKNFIVDSRQYLAAVYNYDYGHSSVPSVASKPVCYVYNATTVTLSEIYCSCPWGFQGNPYLGKNCDDVDECQESQDRRDQYCYGRKCVNYYGSYFCEDDRKKSKLILTASLSSSLGLMLLLIGVWFGYKLLKRRNEIKRKKMFFKRNGGLLLEQQLSSGEVNVEKIKLFKSQELEKSTDNFNADRILGQGGQGTVYKGMLEDGRIVAVKKSKMVDESQLSGFINEVVILSQINHRNVVQLLGCCLETEVPLLVYEFIPNGTLSKYIAEQIDDFPLTWKMRLRIAIEVAGALSYLHCASSFPIYHRDIKSTNILLDDKYRAKIADFGTSRSIAIDQTHLTTSIVHGTFGYLDPEYFQSSQFTEKSDVYSFGVVLVELLTGQKPISFQRSENEGRSLATYFIISMHKDCLFDIVDDQVLKEGSKADILTVANLARRCLYLNGRKRPTMREVTTELEVVQMTEKTSNGEKNYEEVDFVRTEQYEPWDIASSSTETGSTMDIGRVSSFHEIPLLTFKSR